MPKEKQITIRVSDSMKEKIEIRAAEERRTVADYIRVVVQKDIEKNRR